MKLIIYTDGASRGNPGRASYGFTISDEHGKLIHEQGEYIGINTNNVAEYSAVLEAFKYLKRKFQGKLNIELFADSRLIVEQLSGRFKIKNANLKILFDQIKVLEMEIGRVFYTHIPREKNSKADALANKALDSI
ncbi:MAG: ribonuclease HI family protein [Candidatus Daviesbacteria bacterium]|nr:ribonuclease HI family protein [Candidatus Daviesbacteria bacterium]